MKWTIFVFLMVIIGCSSCSSTISNYYEGYIYYNKEPVNNARILEEGTNNYTYTDSRGYFILKRTNKDIILPIIVEKNNIKDSIDLRRKRGAGAKIYYLLVTGKNDTIELDRERIFKSQSY